MSDDSKLFLGLAGIFFLFLAIVHLIDRLPEIKTAQPPPTIPDTLSGPYEAHLIQEHFMFNGQDGRLYWVRTDTTEERLNELLNVW